MKCVCLNLLILVIQIVSVQAQVSLEDLRKAQEDIDTFNYQDRGRCIIFKEGMKNVPYLNILPFNVNEDNRQICIVTYASFNRYDQFLEDMINSIGNSFKGHLLYRRGGWPNSEGQCYTHAFSPYGFKVCAIQEAYNLGYKKILWLDSIVEVLNDLTPLFDLLDTQPFFYRYSHYPFHEHVSPGLIQEFRLEKSEISSYKHIATGVLGFNFSNPACVDVLEKWHEYSKKRIVWSRLFPEQMLLSVILCRMGFEDLVLDNLIYFGEEFSNRHFFRINYSKKN